MIFIRPLLEGWVIAEGFTFGGKSGLHRKAVLVNDQAGQPDGKWYRKLNRLYLQN